MESLSIVYINLDSRPDRRENMERQLSHFFGSKDLHSNAFQRFRAMTPMDVREAEQKGLCHFKPMSGERKGCAYSHFQIWKQFLNSSKQYLMILEDDNRLRKDWLTHVENIINEKEPGIGEKEFDALMFHTSENHPDALRTDPALRTPLHIRKEVWQQCREQCSTGAILYSRQGVQNILNMFPGTSYSPLDIADSMTWKLQYRGRCYMYFPWLAIHNFNFYSDIQGKRAVEDEEKQHRLLRENHVDVEYLYL